MLNRLLAETDVPEREVYDKATANALDRLISRSAAVQRYRVARKYVGGVVVDAACGCGYGSWLLSKCPAVTRVVGFERDTETVEYARAEYGDDKTAFCGADFGSFTFPDLLGSVCPDTVVSLETIEHLTEPERFIDAVLASGASRLVISFPSFETVTFNPYHLRDFTVDEMTALVGCEPAHTIHLDDAVWLLVFDL